MSALAKKYTPQPDDPYYDKGRYLFEVAISKANNRGEPYLNLKCVGSHDGRRIGSYYGMNFFVEATSPAQKTLWQRVLTNLLNTLSIKELNDMEQIPVGTRIGLYFHKSGFAPLPSFYDAEKFDGYTSKPSQYIAANSDGTRPPVNPRKSAADTPPVDVYSEFASMSDDMDAFFEEPLQETSNV